MSEVKSLKTVMRSAGYLHYLKGIRAKGQTETSVSELAAALQLDVQTVSDDFFEITASKEQTFEVPLLIAGIEHYLGYDDTCNAVLVGVGNMGAAILSYQGFADYGIDIVAAFDRDPAVIGTEIAGKKVLDIRKMYELCGRTKVLVGILAVPAHEAQNVCDTMLASGIQAIWNFAPTELSVPDSILVQNENIADSLLTLSGRVEQELKKDPNRLANQPSEFDAINAIMAKYEHNPQKLDQVLQEAEAIGASAAGINYIREMIG